MILKIELENFYSIKEPVILDFIAGNTSSNAAEALADNVIDWKDTKILKTIGLFGQNASGKSNILKAITFCIDLINNSQLYSPSTQFNFTPYKFDGFNEQPSRFYIDFVINNTEYEYTFIIKKNEILYEWLFYYPNNRRAKVFVRTPEKNGYSYEFGTKAIQKPNDVITSTGKQTLFLSRASSMNREIPKNICTYFHDNFITRLENLNKETLAENFTKYKYLILKTLELCDSDITNINLDFERLENGDRPVFTTYHNNNNDIPFDMNREESEGTKNLFNILLRLIDVVEKGSIILLDEFDNSLHTFLADFVINLIHASKNAQMIFTSHNTNLIDVKKLRKDQILFINKKENKFTEAYSLFDFKDFRDTMDAEKGYLQGRFEAVPCVDISVPQIKKLLEK